MAIQLYVAATTQDIPPVTAEEEDMLDFEDIGGVYADNSVGAAAANTTALQTFLDNEGGSTGIALMFSGRRKSNYNNRRVPETAYFRLNGGPITNKAESTAHADINFYGLVGSKLVGMDSLTGTTPMFEFSRRATTSQSIQFHNLVIENTSGSGIKLIGTQAGQGPGQRVILNGMKFDKIATALAEPTFDRDGWTDIDTVPYAIYVDEADGCMISDCWISLVNGNGIVCTRWHAGLLHAGVRECTGTGAKLQQVNGTALQYRAESNKGYGLHIRDTGNKKYETAGLVGSNGAPNAWQVWMEANNARDASYQAYGTSSGYAWRQAKIESSSKLTIGGHSGWGENKINMSGAVRRSNILIDSAFIDPSVDGTNAILVYDLNNDGNTALGGAYDNFSTQWTNVAYRPYITESGDTGDGTHMVDLTIPAEAYDQVATPASGAYWNIQPISFTASAGDMLMITAQVSVNAAGAAYCNSREALTGSDRMPAWLGNFLISGADSAVINYAMWDEATRQFCNRVYVEDSVSCKAQMYAYFSGMGDVATTGTNYPENDIVISIHSLKIYRIPA